jgi:hypothetical protein
VDSLGDVKHLDQIRCGNRGLPLSEDCSHRLLRWPPDHICDQGIGI